jgi:hypothetical protein
MSEYWQDIEIGLNRIIRTNSKTSNEATSIHLSKSTSVCQEDHDTEDPNEAELSCSPKTSDTIAENEGPILHLAFGQ